MGTLLKIVGFVIGIFLLCLLAGFGWLYFYSRDLPDMSALAQYAPLTVTQVTDPCLGRSVAIPYDAIGTNLRKAIGAVETNEDDPGVLMTTLRGLLSAKPRDRRTLTASWYISRSMFCAPSKMLNRQLGELRTAIQLGRRYSRRQLFTIYANRVPIGTNVNGARDGAEFYFHKAPGDLTVSEAALLAGLIRGPSWLSPAKHPDHALGRRNAVIDAMLENGSITVADAQASKAAPLGIVAGLSTPAVQ